MKNVPTSHFGKRNENQNCYNNSEKVIIANE